MFLCRMSSPRRSLHGIRSRIFVSKPTGIIPSSTNCDNSFAFYEVNDVDIKADGKLNYNASDVLTNFYATEDVANKEFWKDYTAQYNIEKVSFK